uniref:Uncharacterized protein n=1 Tax=Rangifer tarandus platyrhynchus TaxID=3082113 RepID=A0ACB0F8I4_RANTA|nr:unnamed protein product [Rangifer tarandus platyrhynchus]
MSPRARAGPPLLPSLALGGGENGVHRYPLPKPDPGQQEFQGSAAGAGAAGATGSEGGASDERCWGRGDAGRRQAEGAEMSWWEAGEGGEGGRIPSPRARGGQPALALALVSSSTWRCWIIPFCFSRGRNNTC